MEYFDDDEEYGDKFSKYSKNQDDEFDFEMAERKKSLERCEKILSTAHDAINHGHVNLFTKCCEKLMDEAHYQRDLYKHIVNELSNLFYFVCEKQEYDMVATLLHYPISKSHVSDVVLDRMLIEKPDFEPFYIMLEHHIKHHEDDDILKKMYQKIIVEMARNNQVSLLSDLLDSHLFYHEKLSEFFFLPLLRACQCGSFGVADLLLSSGYARADDYNSQALQVAYDAGSIDICKYLLTSQYIGVNAKISDNDYEVMMKAFSEGDLDFIQFLAHHSKTAHAFNQDNINEAFIHALKHNAWYAIRYLIEHHDLSFRPQMIDANHTALMQACAQGENDIIDLFLHSPNIQNPDIKVVEERMLGAALVKNQWRTVKHLLLNTEIKDSEHFSLYLEKTMSCAIQTQELEMALWLINKRSGLTQLFDNTTDKNALFFRAIDAKFFDLAHALLDLEPKKRPDINAQNGLALQKVMDLSQWDQARTFLEQGAKAHFYQFETINGYKQFEMITEMLALSFEPLTLNAKNISAYLIACAEHNSEMEMVQYGFELKNLPDKERVAIEDRLLNDFIYRWKAWPSEFLVIQYGLEFTPERRQQLDIWAEQYSDTQTGKNVKNIQHMLTVMDNKKTLEAKLGGVSHAQKKRKI